MEYYNILLPLALILLTSKLLAKGCGKIGLPNVVGLLLSGVLIGFINYIPNQSILTDTTISGLGFFAKIGVILIMFSAGLETEIKQIKAIGLPAILITLAGVILPLAFGFSVSALFNGGFHNMEKQQLLSNLFYGVILTATSVSVTVATLKELGKLSGKVGSTIVSAAILDDIIGVVILSFIIGMSGNSATEGAEAVAPTRVLLMTGLFFVFVILVGIVFNKVFKWLAKRYPHHRLIPILAISMCFFFAYASEKWFGVADITGAFAAGLILAGTPEATYIDRKSDIMGYMIFAPVFFTNIGITTTFSDLNGEMLFFGMMFIIAGILGKLLGCGLTAKMCKYSWKDSLRVGIGMMARAEVALVCTQKGVENGLVSPSIMPFVLILIIITSFVTPITLKVTYNKKTLTNNSVNKV